MKKLLIVLGALALLLLVVSVAQAQTYVILPYADGQTYTIPPGESALVGYGWLACNQGLIIDYMNAFDLELVFEDGTPLYHLTDKKDPYWWDIYQWESPPEEGCLTESANYEVWWVYPISLEPGVYNINFHYGSDHLIPDGFDSNSDGVPDFYDGIWREGTFTLIFQ